METPTATPAPSPAPVQPPVATPPPEAIPGSSSREPSPGQGKHVSKGVIVGIVVTALVIAYAVAAMMMGLWPFAPEPMATGTPSPSPSVSGEPAGGTWKSYGSVATGFGLQYPPDMTVTEEAGQDPVDPSKKWTSLRLTGQDLVGNILINVPPAPRLKAAEPTTTGTVSADGTTITYKTGLQDHGADGMPSGPERAWVGVFSASGDSYEFGFVSESGADKTELVNTILASFTFPPPAGQ